MDFENFIDTICFDLVLEGIGTVFACSLLWKLFLHNSLSSILALFITSIC